MRYVIILCMVLMTFSYSAFTPWIDKQLKFTYQLNEENLTQKSIEKILTAQDTFHDWNDPKKLDKN